MSSDQMEEEADSFIGRVKRSSVSCHAAYLRFKVLQMTEPTHREYEEAVRQSSIRYDPLLVDSDMAEQIVRFTERVSGSVRLSCLVGVEGHEGEAGKAVLHFYKERLYQEKSMEDMFRLNFTKHNVITLLTKAFYDEEAILSAITFEVFKRRDSGDVVLYVSLIRNTAVKALDARSDLGRTILIQNGKMFKENGVMVRLLNYAAFKALGKVASVTSDAINLTNGVTLPAPFLNTHSSGEYMLTVAADVGKLLNGDFDKPVQIFTQSVGYLHTLTDKEKQPSCRKERGSWRGREFWLNHCDHDIDSIFFGMKYVLRYGEETSNSCCCFLHGLF